NDALVVKTAKKIIDSIEESSKSEGTVTFSARGHTFQRAGASIDVKGEVIEVHERRDRAIQSLGGANCVCLKRGWRPINANPSAREFYEANVDGESEKS